MKLPKRRLLPILCLYLYFISIMSMEMERHHSHYHSHHKHKSLSSDGWEDFRLEAESKIMPSTESACLNASNCRNQKEMIYVAYKKMILLNSKLDISKSFIVSVDPNMMENGISKVVFSTSNMAGVGSGSPLFK
jgi:hypothetical protein